MYEKGWVAGILSFTAATVFSHSLHDFQINVLRKDWCKSEEEVPWMQYMCLDLNAIDLKAVRVFKCNKILVKKLPMYRVKKVK